MDEIDAMLVRAGVLESKIRALCYSEKPAVAAIAVALVVEWIKQDSGIKPERLAALQELAERSMARARADSGTPP